MAGFSDRVLRRDKTRWPYAHLLSAADGTRLIETVHRGEPSLQAEVLVSAARIAAGEPNLGGQIPARIDVDGVAEDTWRNWVSADAAPDVDG